ncbi:MAG: hypothetical protein LC102_03725 [Ignavibacteriales bacterium]|nr:hypothetical protein [Ignavibacteriales bacterium]
MKFVSKYRKYSITINRKKFSFAPDGVSSTYATKVDEEISLLKSSPSFNKDYSVMEEKKEKK